MTAALGAWADRAACAGRPANLWLSEDHHDQQAAAQVCHSCPVQAECLTYAQQWHANPGTGIYQRPLGVWGGWLFRDGDKPAPVGAPRVAAERPAPRPLQPCGTNAAYERHRYRGETPCPPCLTAGRATANVRQRKYDQKRAQEKRRGAS